MQEAGSRFLGSASALALARPMVTGPRAWAWRVVVSSRPRAPTALQQPTAYTTKPSGPFVPPERLALNGPKPSLPSWARLPSKPVLSFDLAETDDLRAYGRLHELA